MTQLFYNGSPVLLALLGGLLTWMLTALGGASVFVFRPKTTRFMNACLGFAAGIMMAGTYFSLLAPALDMGAGILPVVIGFLLGGAFLLLAERFLRWVQARQQAAQDLCHPSAKGEASDSGRSKARTALLVLAITLHNIPEGLAIGVAFGMAGQDPKLLGVAVALCIGIGIQDIPEGAAISIPLRREGLSVRKAFWYGQLSGVVEPLAALVGALLTIWIQALLPWALSFAAGAMYFVVVRELVPEAQRDDSSLSAIMGLLGFALMMFLDVALGA